MAGGWFVYPFNLCHCKEQSDAAIPSFEDVWVARAGAGGHTGPPLRGYREKQQVQGTGGDGVRPYTVGEVLRFLYLGRE